MKAFISTLLASLAITAPVLAAPLPADHKQFLNTLSSDGVLVFINEPAEACYGDVDIDGSYFINYQDDRVLVVCQDNRRNSDEVSWTANDLDTIRHEGFHIIQDCMVGDKNDMELDTVFINHDEVIDALGVEQAMEIMLAYSELYEKDGHDRIKYEIEAFYAARDLSASELESMYQTYCM